MLIHGHRTTTKTDEMIEKLQSFCSFYEEPHSTVTIRFESPVVQQNVGCGILLDEGPPGAFKLNKDKGCTYLKTVPDNKTEFVCVGR